MRKRNDLLKRGFTGIVLVAVSIGVAATTLGAPPEELAELSTKELYQRAPSDKAARVAFDRRLQSMIPDERSAFFDSVREEGRQRRMDGPTLASAEALLERMKVEASAPVWVGFRETYAALNEGDQRVVRQQFLEDWNELSYPSLDDGTEAARAERSYFNLYLRESGRMYEDETEFLDMLARQCLGRGFEGEMDLYLSGFYGYGGTYGPKIAQRMEALLAAAPAWGFAEMGYADHYDAYPKIYTILGACREDGLEVILRLGTESKELGILALGNMKTMPQAETLLRSIYEERVAKSQESGMVVLYKLVDKQQDFPDEDRRNWIRQELVKLLHVPDGPVDLGMLNTAVQTVSATRDPWFRTYLDAFAEEIRQIDPTRASNFAYFPESVDRAQQALEREIVKATKELAKAQEKAQVSLQTE